MPGGSVIDPIDTVEERCPFILSHAQLQAVEMCICLPVFLYLTGHRHSYSLWKTGAAGELFSAYR